MRGRILLIEPNADVARSIAAVLEMHHFEIVRAENEQEAIARIGGPSFDVMVIDVKVSGDASGLPFLQHLLERAPHLMSRVIVISGHPAEDVRRELAAIGVCDIVPKPVDADEIVKAVLECLDKMPSTVQ